MDNHFEKEMTQYEAAGNPLPPPCREELIGALFDIVREGEILSNGHFLTPADRIRTAYPDITEAELRELSAYLDEAEFYCEDVSSCFSRQYGTPFVPESEDARRDMLRVIEVCKKKYPWLRDEQVRNIVGLVCWLANR